MLKVNYLCVITLIFVLFLTLIDCLMPRVRPRTDTYRDCSPDLEWNSIEFGKTFPDNAIKGGNDVDGQPLYVCRAAYKNNPGVPGKASPTIGCHIPYGGNEHRINFFQLLTNPKSIPLEWKSLVDPTQLPKEAVKAGKTIRGEQQYIGRCRIQIGRETSLVLGKVHKKSKGYPLYFSFEGGEITCWQYEILTCPKS